MNPMENNIVMLIKFLVVYMYINKVKTSIKLTLKQTTENHNRPTALARPFLITVGVGGAKSILLAQPRLRFLKWFKTFSWSFGSHT